MFFIIKIIILKNIYNLFTYISIILKYLNILPIIYKDFKVIIINLIRSVFIKFKFLPKKRFWLF